MIGKVLREFTLITAFFLLTSCASNTKAISIGPLDVQSISNRIYQLADDSMRGRYTPSPELERTAWIIATHFKNLDLESGVPDNSYIQRYEIPGENKLTAPNVIGILRGTDPKLKNEYVVFSAHMDHVGVGNAVNGDVIYNGADDNASGTSAVMEIAKAISGLRLKPKRSMIFLLVSGEEEGLWGSAWFAKNPIVPLNSIVANLNVDMIGRNQSDRIVAIGKSFSSLGNTVEKIAHKNPDLGLKVIDDPWPEESLFYRSDHYNFAVKGIPILFFFNGIHEDYHMPSDEADKINFEYIARVARLVALTGFNVANTEERPKWDKKAYERIVQ